MTWIKRWPVDGPLHGASQAVVKDRYGVVCRASAFSVSDPVPDRPEPAPKLPIAFAPPMSVYQATVVFSRRRTLKPSPSRSQRNYLPTTAHAVAGIF